VIVTSPAYLDRRGRPTHPADRAHHDCFGYAYLRARDTWHFTNAAGDADSVRPSGRLRVNNGDAILPALIVGLGVAALPEFIARPAIADGRLKQILPERSWSQSSLYLVIPPNGPRPARVQAMADFLIQRLSRT
jgi:DNA-binding transcriptional LysR family regulator